MQKIKAKAKIYTPEQWAQQQRRVPDSLMRTAGMLKHKRKALEEYLKELRTAWDCEHYVL